VEGDPRPELQVPLSLAISSVSSFPWCRFEGDGSMWQGPKFRIEKEPVLHLRRTLELIVLINSELDGIEVYGLLRGLYPWLSCIVGLYRFEQGRSDPQRFGTEGAPFLKDVATMATVLGDLNWYPTIVANRKQYFS